MSSVELVGSQHRELVSWLSNHWWMSGSPVCVMDGFSGVGKTELSRRLRLELQGKASAIVSVDVPEPGGSQLDDLILDLAQQLAEAGLPELAADVDAGADQQRLFLTLEGLLRQPILVVFDEFQRGLNDEGEPIAPFRRILERVGQRPERPGRILLLTSRRPREGKWSRSLTIKEVEPLTADEAGDYLARALKSRGREGVIPANRHKEIAVWAGRNPEAINLLVAALGSRPVNDLIGEAPKPWELKERAVSAQLLADLKRELLGTVLADLDDASRRSLQYLSVHRKAVKHEAIDALSPSTAVAEELRRRLVDLFLIEHWQGWYTVHSVAAEVMRESLKAQREELKVAHAAAAQYYARHFKAKQIVGAGRLGSYFVEARHHLVAAEQLNELKDIAARFAAHLKSHYVSVTPVPTDPDELDERIATLMALLDKAEGPKGLEYHLARCLQQRMHAGDLAAALGHARRATGPQAPFITWNLRIRLERDVHGTAEAVKAAREGIKVVSPDANLFSLYQLCAEILARDGKPDEALKLLREGIGRVPPEHGLFALYKTCAESLARDGEPDEAVKLLREGIGRVPPEGNLFALYQSCAEILGREGKPDEAVKLLREGIGKIGTSKFNGYRLAESIIFIATAETRSDWIDALLAAQGQAALSTRQRALADMMRCELNLDWQGAIGIARAARQANPRYYPFATQEAFALLCLGRDLEAREAFSSFPSPIEHGSKDPSTWLACLIAVRLKDLAEARRLWQIYLGGPAENVDVADLLTAWNAPRPLSTPTPSYYFPTFPKELTQLPEDLRRTSSGAPISPEKLQIGRAVSSGPSRSGPAIGADENSTLGDSAGKLHSLSTVAAAVQAGTSRHAVLAVATEWFSKYGGLSTLNRELCIGLAAQGHKVACLVPSSDAEEKEHALMHRVTLVDASPVGGGAEPEVALVLRSQLPEGFVPSIIVGHGRITGGAARVQVTDYYPMAMRVHFLHMQPGEIEFIKGRDGAALRAEEREDVEKDLCSGAALVVAVGPRLYRWAQTLLNSLHNAPGLHQLDPGIVLGWEPKPPKGNIECLVLGRAEDLELKGLDIAARAMGRLPGSSVLGSDAELVVRGAPADTGLALQQELVSLSGKPNLRVQVREYSPDLERLAADLRRSSLVLMPSRAEGFGLVALEGIVAGRHVLVSRQSGLGELLLSTLGNSAASSFVVDVSQDVEQDAKEWAKAIEFVLRDRGAAFSRAMQLRSKLAEKLTWADAVSSLIQAIEALSAFSRGNGE